jgi:ribosomal protein S18 acetylase RimI-like enzyme
MPVVRDASAADLPALAQFIAARNRHSAQHCLHCGEQASLVAGEIAQLRWGEARAGAACFLIAEDATFPGTYADGAAILAALDEQHQLLVCAAGHTVQGYVYITVDADPHEAYIRFVGVSPDARGQGLGRRLLGAALHWAFAQPGLDQVALTVSEERNIARRLYESAGFQHRFAGVNHRWLSAKPR